MTKQQGTAQIPTETLMAKIAFLESGLAERNAVIGNYETVIANYETVIAKNGTVIEEQGTAISNLTADNNAAKFEIDQLRRMIYGSKRERFVSAIDPNQLRIEFEPKSVEIEEAVKKEREAIRVSYLRSKPKKKHPGRMELPSHLPVEETVLEPSEDTSSMVCRSGSSPASCWRQLEPGGV